MPPSFIAVLAAAFLSCHWAEGAYKYTFELKKDEPFEPCDLKGFTNVDTVFDLSNIKFDRDDDDNVIVEGSWKFKKDVGTLEMILEGKQYQQGNWMTLITVTKYDYCEFIISPSEGAETVFGTMDPKRCPFDADTVYSLQPTSLHLEFETPYTRGQGELLITVKFINKAKNIASCVQILGDLH